MMAFNVTCKLPVDFSFSQKFLPPVYATVFIVGMIGNCLGLKSMYNNWRKIGNVNFFMLNLCLADILYLFTLPFLVAYYAFRSTWTFGHAFCKIIRLCFCINLYGSIGFLTCISVYRYLGIVHTLRVKGRITTRLTLVICLLVWSLVFALCLPDVFFDKTSKNRPGCFDTSSNEYIREYLKYSIGRTVFGFVVPLMIMVCCYGHVAFTLMTKKNIDVLLKVRCVRLVIILTLLFSICFTPYHILKNLNLATRILKLNGNCHQWYSGVYIANLVGNSLAALNCAINPLVYMFNSDKILWCRRRRQYSVEGHVSAS